MSQVGMVTETKISNNSLNNIKIELVVNLCLSAKLIYSDDASQKAC